MCHVDVIYILHQLSSSLLTNIFVQSTAKIIGNVIFTIRECGIKYSNLLIAALLHQLISRINSARTGPHNNYIIFHSQNSFLR